MATKTKPKKVTKRVEKKPKIVETEALKELWKNYIMEGDLSDVKDAKKWCKKMMKDYKEQDGGYDYYVDMSKSKNLTDEFIKEWLSFMKFDGKVRIKVRNGCPSTYKSQMKRVVQEMREEFFKDKK